VLLDAENRLFQCPALDNIEGRWCHYTTGRVRWDELPFPLVTVILPNYETATTSPLAAV
jgi:hypothetical protein